MLEKRIESVEIQNFLGIREGKVENLGDINLIVGKNGSGKTTLLEAMFLVSSLFPPPSRNEFQQLWEPQSWGGNRQPDKSSWLASRRNLTGVIRDAGHHVGERSIVYPPEYRFERNTRSKSCIGLGTTWGDGLAKGYVVTAESPGGEHERPEAFAVKLQQSHPAWVVAAFSEAVYLDALMSSDSRFEKVLWGVMLRVNRKSRLVDLFNQAYHFGIQSVDYDPQTGQLIVAPASGGRGLPLDNLGAGMRIAFRLFLLTLLLEDTFVLLEEFDAYQHPQSLRNIVRGLVQVCKENRLQLFATTHRAESISVFLDCVKEVGGLDGNIVATALDSTGHLETRTIPFDDARGIHGGGFDLRDVEDFIG